MAATTTQYHPLRFPGEKLVPIGTTTTDVCYISTGDAMVFGNGSTILFPPTLWSNRTTAGDVIRIPLSEYNGKVGFLLCYNASVSSNGYPCLAVRLPHNSGSTDPSAAWMQPRYQTNAIGMGTPSIGTSTQDAGWLLLTATTNYIGLTTQAAFYLAGPLDSAKFGFIAATSETYIDKYQTYVEVMMGHSTQIPAYGASSTAFKFATTSNNFLQFSTAQAESTEGGFMLQAFEFP